MSPPLFLEVQAPSPLSGHEHSAACLLSIAVGRCISFHLLSFSCCVLRPYVCVLEINLTFLFGLIFVFFKANFI